MATVAEQLEVLIGVSRQLVTLGRMLHADLGGGASAPEALKTRVRAAAPGQVGVTFSWIPANDGGVTASYLLTVLDPDGVVINSQALPGTVAEFVLTMPDDPRTYSAALQALNSAGSGDAPARTVFSPHIEPPPPVPATPSGFHATVNPAALAMRH